MNCYKFATVKAGSIASGFAFKLTQNFGDQEVKTASISESSPLNLDLTYKDLCRISQGVDIGKPWAIRGPYCDRYHRYFGKIVVSGWVGQPGDLGTWNSLVGGTWQTYNIGLFVSYDLWGECPHDKLDGRLNAYGRKAKKEADNAEPPGPEPCPTEMLIEFYGIPLDVTDPSENPELNVPIQHGLTPGFVYAYGKTNDDPYISTGTLVLYFTQMDGEPGGYPYAIELTGTRNIQIEDTWGG